ncbi:MAG: ABC transporter substrate-binding protein [Ruminococcaceae bacterium]|nr:ABC transporter substrate-binding protein [Oscillospiraceae bacterium]
MKEKIYTIPLSDAFAEPCECPFCVLEKKLEAEQVTYALGASMMEPDSRILSNEKGYCRRHFEQMSREGKALSLGLVLDTHLNQLIRELEAASSAPKAKGGLFKKATEKDPVIDVLETNQTSCLICDKLEHTLEKFAEVFWYLYKNEPDFKEKVSGCQGFCLPHFKLLLACADHELSGKTLEDAKAEVTALELTHLKRINDEVNWFTKKFDYRNQNEPWGNSKDAPQRAMEKLSKFL